MTYSWNHNQKEFYDKSVASFDRKGSSGLFHRDNRNHLIKIKEIANALDLQAGELVLEIGIGTGIHAEWVIKQKSLTLVGVELSCSMIDAADARLKNHNLTSYHLIQGVREKLCFSDNTFDAVYCSGTLHHVESPLDVICEMKRVTKPGGYIGVMEPNWLFPINAFAGISQKNEKNILSMRKSRLETWAEFAGLTDVKVDNLLYTPPVPSCFAHFYDHIDYIFEKIPLIRYLSIMLFLCGKKPVS